MKQLSLSILLVFGISLNSLAQQISWNGSVSTDWNTSENWTPAGVPSPSQVVVIPLEPTNQPVLNTSSTIRAMYLHGNLTIGSSGNLTVHGSQSDFLTIDVYGLLTNNGTIQIRGAPTGPGVNGEIYVWSGKFVNSGTIINTYDRFILLTGDSGGTEHFLNTETGIVTHSGSSFLARVSNTKGLTNRGLMESTNGGALLEINTSNQVVNSGTMRANSSNGLALTVSTGSFTNEACGIVENGSGDISVTTGIFTNAGMIRTKGNFTSSSTFNNSGVLAGSSFVGINNTGLQIRNTAYPDPIFIYGSGNTYAVNGIFKDSASTISAGTFVAPNNFTPYSTTSDLFAQIGNGTCNFAVAFTYDMSAFPVSLISFTGQNQGKNNLLEWKTSEEQNNSGFEIEKSIDAKTFERIGSVDGSGNSKVFKVYQFTDPNPFSTTYYRLKQIDFDGTFSYSRIISVKADMIQFSIYPNPAQKQLFVKDLEGNTEVSISDIRGKLLVKKIAKPATPIDISNLPPGFFLVTIGDRSQKLVVQK